MKGETPLVPRSAWNTAFWMLRVPFAAERRVVGIPRGAWNENLTALAPEGGFLSMRDKQAVRRYVKNDKK